MTDVRLLPNFFIIGAPKAGTTSIFNSLTAHPQVFPSPVKEPGFFNHDGRYQRGLDWYAHTYFSESAAYPIRMEATPAYLTWSDKTAPRIAALEDPRSIKFCAIFRDPVARAYSHYWHRVRLGHEKLTFQEAIAAEERRLASHWAELSTDGDGRYGYFRAGCYASRLAPFLRQFEPDQFFFFLQEDLAPDRFPAASQRLLDFLQLDTGYPLAIGKDNPAVLPRARWLAALYKFLKGTPLAGVYRRTVSKSDRQSIHQNIFKPAQYPPMDPALENDLRSRYREEIRALEQIIHRDLSHWLQPESTTNLETS